MKHLDLFTGIGGFALAASWVWGNQHEIHTFVEIDPYCQKVLNRHWPGTTIHGDIRTYQHDGTDVDLVTGGFPCQPFSQAGRRGGRDDNRYLWPEMLGVIETVRPRWVIGENVFGLFGSEAGMVFEQVCLDLEGLDFEVWPLRIPAIGVGALHIRDRVWIVAHAKTAEIRSRSGEIQAGALENQAIRFGNGSQNMAHSYRFNGQACRSYKMGNGKPIRKGSSSYRSWWAVEPDVGRVAHGVPRRVDRLRGLGNAIVPQCVVPIMQTIKILDEGNHGG